MEKKHMGNNPGISNIQALIETCSQDRYGKDGNLGEIRGGFILGLPPSVRNETGLGRITNLHIPDGSDGKESACSAREPCSIPGSGRSPGEGNGNPLQYSCLGNPMGRGA